MQLSKVKPERQCQTKLRIAAWNLGQHPSTKILRLVQSSFFTIILGVKSFYDTLMENGFIVFFVCTSTILHPDQLGKANSERRKINTTKKETFSLVIGSGHLCWVLRTYFGSALHHTVVVVEMEKEKGREL